MKKGNQFNELNVQPIDNLQLILSSLSFIFPTIKSIDSLFPLHLQNKNPTEITGTVKIDILVNYSEVLIFL